jgi:hypothetical protein
MIRISVDVKQKLAIRASIHNGHWVEITHDWVCYRMTEVSFVKKRISISDEAVFGKV